MESGAYDAFGNAQGHVFTFDNAGAGHEEKLTGVGMPEMREGISKGGKHDYKSCCNEE